MNNVELTNSSRKDAFAYPESITVQNTLDAICDYCRLVPLVEKYLTFFSTLDDLKLQVKILKVP